MAKKLGSGISNTEKQIFWVKILKFFDADPEIFLTLDPE
jgi:hypothetical protein